MTSILNLNSSDSEDDCDYVPPAGELSECSDGDISSPEKHDTGDQVGEKCKQRQRRRKRKGTHEVEQDSNKEDKPKLSEEEEKKRVDEIWKNFQQDTKSVLKKPVSNVTLNSDGTKALGNVLLTDSPKTVVTEEYEFAGEKVTVTKPVSSKSLHSSPLELISAAKSPVTKSPISGNVSKRPVKGLASVIGSLSKKPKLSTLQKSMLDWSSFKREEGIEEDLEHHNKGKDGYLEKQAFLQRSDLRQFEIEKDIRQSKRTKP